MHIGHCQALKWCGVKLTSFELISKTKLFLKEKLLPLFQLVENQYV